MSDDARKKPRKTQQRGAISRAIADAEGPLSVPEIHGAAKRSIENIGIATIYRNVKLLLDAGEIQPIILPDGVTRYEPAGLKHHHHFRCRECDRVYDLDVCPVSLPAGTTLPSGFHVEDHELTFYGTCALCNGADAGS